MTKKIHITNADGSHWGVRVKHSSGETRELPYPGDSADFYISGSQSLSLEITEYDPFAIGDADKRASGPTGYGLFQNAASRQFIPGVWCYSTHQLMDPAAELSDEIRARIMTNCGCDADGRYWDDNGEARPAFGRLFEQADTNAERDRLERFNATPAVYDIAYLNGEPVLNRSKDHHMAEVAGIPTGRNPNVYAVRCRDEEAFNEWCRFMAPSRSNPGA